MRRLTRPVRGYRTRVGRALPWGLLGMVGLVAAVECFVARHPLDFTDTVSLNWRLSARAARAEAPGHEILCVGDSLVKHGVIPKVLQKHSGRSACSLTVARGPAPLTYFLLRRALEASARPTAVVVNFKPAVLIGDTRYNLRYWQEIVSPREGLELARASGGGSILVAIALGRLVPSVRSRHEIRDNVRAALRGETAPLRKVNQVCERNWRVNDGANVAARNPAFKGIVGPAEHQRLVSNSGYCHPVNAFFVRRFLDLTAEHGIRVYWLLPPLSPQLQAGRERSGAEATYLRFVRSLQARHSHLTVVDGRHSGYEPGVFVDPTHLDKAGAYALSVDLAAILRRDLAGASRGPRWVDLPAFRERPVTVPLEDVEQSREALNALR